MTTPLLEIKNLHARVADKEIIKDLNLTINSGEVHAIMGPNGAGKSSLSYVLSGKEGYTVTSGSITFKGQDLLSMSTEERARNGLFLSMQYPIEIPGVMVSSFLKQSLNKTETRATQTCNTGAVILRSKKQVHKFHHQSRRT